MFRYLKNILSVLFVLATSIAAAQPEDVVEMGDGIRSNGMIWIVVGVISIIFVGITIFLFYLDKKISKLEKSI